MQKYCRTSPLSAFRSQELFFCLLALNFFGQKFRPYYFPFALYSVMETCFSLSIFFPTVIHFTDNWTNSCSSVLPKKTRKLGQQKEVVTPSAARGTCNDLSSNQLQLVTPKPHTPSPPKLAALVCHFALAAARGCMLPGPAAKPSLAPRGRSWLSATGQGHFSGGIWKGTWLVEAGQALKGSVCCFH